MYSASDGYNLGRSSKSHQTADVANAKSPVSKSSSRKSTNLGMCTSNVTNVPGLRTSKVRKDDDGLRTSKVRKEDTGLGTAKVSNVTGLRTSNVRREDDGLETSNVSKVTGPRTSKVRKVAGLRTSNVGKDGNGAQCSPAVSRPCSSNSAPNLMAVSQTPLDVDAIVSAAPEWSSKKKNPRRSSRRLIPPDKRRLRIATGSAFGHDEKKKRHRAQCARRSKTYRVKQKSPNGKPRRLHSVKIGHDVSYRQRAIWQRKIHDG